MINLRYLPLFSVLAICACTRTETTPSPAYQVNNLHNVTMNIGDTVWMPLEIEHLGGTREVVNLSVGNLPNPVLYWFSQSSGIPGFGTQLKLVPTIHTRSGKYQARVMVKGSATTPQSLDFSIEIPSTPTNNLCGKWNLVKEGTDENHNNIVDEGEISPPVSKKVSLEVWPAHTGLSSITLSGSPQQTEPISWQLTGNNTFLEIIKGAETGTYNIHAMASGDMVLKFSDTWLIYKKQ